MARVVLVMFISSISSVCPLRAWHLVLQNLLRDQVLFKMQGTTPQFSQVQGEWRFQWGQGDEMTQRTPERLFGSNGGPQRRCVWWCWWQGCPWWGEDEMQLWYMLCVSKISHALAFWTKKLSSRPKAWTKACNNYQQEGPWQTVCSNQQKLGKHNAITITQKGIFTSKAREMRNVVE